MRTASKLVILAGLLSACGSSQFAFYEPVAARTDETTDTTASTTTVAETTEVALPPEAAV